MHKMELTTAELLHLRIFRSGRNQRQAADALGISNATLSRIVRARRKPTIQQARDIRQQYKIGVRAWQ